MTWHSFHVYYHEPAEKLILNAVRPLFRALAGDVDAMYFTRHWRQGPHVRLNFRCDDDTVDDVIGPAVHDLVETFLDRYPSTRHLDQKQNLDQHQRLAELEQDHGPLLPWFADNSVHRMPYENRVDVLGNTAASDMLADFYTDTNEITFDMIDRIDRGGKRGRYAFDLMIATADVLSGIGIARAYVSFRSHAEAFLCGYPEGRGLRRKWDAHYQRNAGSLVRYLYAVIKPAEGRSRLPWVREWTRVLAPYKERARRLLAADSLDLDPDAQSSHVGLAALTEVSVFHRALFNNPTWHKTQRSPGFLVYRVMLNYVYLHLTRIGVVPAERFLLCHLLAHAVEDAFSVSGIDLARGHTPGGT